MPLFPSEDPQDVYEKVETSYLHRPEKERGRHPPKGAGA